MTRAVVIVLALWAAVAAVAGGDDSVFISDLSPAQAHAKAFVDLRVFSPTQPSNRVSYSGFVTVNATANYFIWFVEALAPVDAAKDVPIVLWLQGGPGCADSLGFFEEIGPFLLVDSVVQDNPYSWSNEFHAIFIDNPVGSGFSFGGPLVTNDHDVAANLESVLSQFFDKFQEYSTNPLFIFGESWGGKAVPALSAYVQQLGSKYNFQGFGVGDGLTNPFAQIQAHADHVYNVGLATEKQRTVIQAYQDKARALVEVGDFLAARDARDAMFDYIEEITNDVNLYDYRIYTAYNHTPTVQYVNQPTSRSALHVGDHTYTEMCSSVVESALGDEIMRSVAEVIPGLLDQYRGLFYQGQFDLRDGYAENNFMLEALKWHGIPRFLNADTQVWKVDGTMAGYARVSGNLNQVMVIGAGHLCPKDQPRTSLDMLTRFVRNLPWV